MTKFSLENHVLQKLDTWSLVNLSESPQQAMVSLVDQIQKLNSYVTPACKASIISRNNVHFNVLLIKIAEQVKKFLGNSKVLQSDNGTFWSLFSYKSNRLGTLYSLTWKTINACFEMENVGGCISFCGAFGHPKSSVQKRIVAGISASVLCIPKEAAWSNRV